MKCIARRTVKTAARNDLNRSLRWQIFHALDEGSARREKPIRTIGTPQNFGAAPSNSLLDLRGIVSQKCDQILGSCYARSRQAGPQKRDHGRAGRKSASHASQRRVYHVAYGR